MTPRDDTDGDEAKIVRARVAISKIATLERYAHEREDERERFSIPWNLVVMLAIAGAACFGLYLAGSMLTSAIHSLPF